MKTYLAIGVVCLGLVGCSTAALVQSTSIGTSVCADVAKAKATPIVAAALDAQVPTSSIGVLWADAKSACVGAVVAPGVTTDWAGLIWGEVKVLAPTVLPILIGLL